MCSTIIALAIAWVGMDFIGFLFAVWRHFRAESSLFVNESKIQVGVNNNAASLHRRLERILEYYSIDLDVDAIEAIKDQAVFTFNRLTRGYKEYQLVVGNIRA